MAKFLLTFSLCFLKVEHSHGFLLQTGIWLPANAQLWAAPSSGEFAAAIKEMKPGGGNGTKEKMMCWCYQRYMAQAENFSGAQGFSILLFSNCAHSQSMAVLVLGPSPSYCSALLQN